MLNYCRDRGRGPKCYWWLIFFSVFFFFSSCLLRGLLAEVTVAQRRELKSVKTLLRNAKQLEQKGALTRSAKLTRQVHDRLDKLLAGADDALRKQTQRPFQDFTKLHAALEAAGASMGSYQHLESLVRGTVSRLLFSKKVAPILIAKCAQCHIDRQQGGVSMATFAALLKGPEAGRIVLPGAAEGSRLIEVIENGDMPRGGLKVTDQELQTLKQWIREGAEFDGEDRQENLTSLSPDTKKATPAKVPVTNATGSETMSFSRDLAKVLNQRCANCHGNDRPVRARLNLTTFQGLLRGGDNGPSILPGKPDESLLLRKLKGTADGARMPQRGAPLTGAVIAQFETWIREGAHFDGPDPKQHVREIAAITNARLATHQKLRDDRSKLALDHWRLVMPDTTPARIETEHFLLLGNIDARELNEYAVAAERLVPRIAKTLRAPSGQPLVKGAMTLFFFKSSYDYGEMGRMVEKRDVNPSSRAHFRYSIVDAYAAINLSRADTDALDTVLTRQIAGLYVSSLGRIPVWFRHGVATAVAARLTPRSDVVANWNSQFDDAFKRLQKHDDFLAGRSMAADAELLAYGFARFLMSDSRRFQKLLGRLRERTGFAASFEQAYGAAPEQVAKVWTRREANEVQRRSRRR